MKYFLSILPIVFLLITSRSCDQKVQTPDGPALGDTLTINYQQTVLIAEEGLAISFQEIKDSRCPTGTNCIRAGEAKVFVTVDHQGSKKTLEMKVEGLCNDRTGSCGSNQALLGYAVQLLTADPYPSQEAKPVKSDSKVRLVVSRITQ